MSMTKDEALKLALEAFEWNLPVVEDWGGKDNLSLQHKAITAIREALAQPAQEPVAWITKNGKGWLRWHRPEDNEKNKDSIPLYTTPPHRKPPQFPTVLRKMWSGTEVQEWINENWSNT